MSRAETAVALTQALARAERVGVGRAYPAELRGQVVGYARRRREEGAADERIARELGLAAMTLRRWAGVRASAFAATEVIEGLSERQFVVHGPRGLRVEGLDLGQVAELWVRLS
jgi:hypothetical protein